MPGWWAPDRRRSGPHACSRFQCKIKMLAKMRPGSRFGAETHRKSSESLTCLSLPISDSEFSAAAGVVAPISSNTKAPLTDWAAEFPSIRPFAVPF